MDMSIESRSRQFGKVFDHWQIKEFLGSGSGGKTAVFRLQRIDSSWGVCALKIVNLIEERGNVEELSDARRADYQNAREECSRNAEREVRLMEELRGNTNIVDYLDHTFVDWSEEDCFGRDLLIRMELLTDLRSELRQGKYFSETEILKIGRDVCAALVRCHSKNILHRDVKPENIFRNKDGDYKLGDFGVSRVLDACPGAVASTGIGTYEYWPTEQMTGNYDTRVDIYSLGLVLYELSNQNRLPFAASVYTTSKEVSLRHAGTALPKPTQASPGLVNVILKACAFKPADRYQNAAAFLNALNQVSQEEKAALDINTPSCSNDLSTHYETVPACPLTSHHSAFETQLAQSRNDITDSTYDDQSPITKQRKKSYSFLLAALLLCAAVGVLTGLKFWKSGNHSEGSKLVEEKIDEETSAYDAHKDYDDNSVQLDGSRIATEIETTEFIEEEKDNTEPSSFDAHEDYGDNSEQFQLAVEIDAAESLGIEDAQLEGNYSAAEKLFQAGYYDQAIAAFDSLNGYKDSNDRILEIRYVKACKLFSDGNYDRAIVAFESLGDYRDSPAQILKARQAKEAAESGLK